MKAVLLSILFLNTAHAAKISCNVKWTTLAEDLPATKMKVEKTPKSLKVTESLEVVLSPHKKGIQVQVIEPIKSNPNSKIVNSFACDKNLNCEGYHEKTLEGKTTKSKLAVSPSNYIVRGSLEGRDYFLYQNLPNKSYEYNFIAYYSEKNLPLGLKVVCHE